MILGEIEVFEDSPWTQDSNGTYIWRSEDTQNNFWTSYNVQLTFSAQEVRKNVHSITGRLKIFWAQLFLQLQRKDYMAVWVPMM